MTASAASLDDLRRRIDEIDDALHDLIMERIAIVERIAGTKQRDGVAAFRPGREAQILRRLAARHRGPLPRAIVVRLWRELLSGTVALQGDFAVAVSAVDDRADYWDLARDHFGSHTPMTIYHSVGEVLRAVGEKRAAIGVLPVPFEGEPTPWWPLLADAGAAAPRVLARLPFGGRGNARGDGGVDALAIGHGMSDATGADRSLVAVETDGEVSRARLIDTLKSVGLTVTLFAAFERENERRWSLVELDDMVPTDDPRLARALALLAERVAGIAHLGGYAKPLPPAALGASSP
ncbi:MAG TPA: chorismate mutase [Stellaceae bacterium]|nr:chorismate mutase [Stellaceae bacterium]